MVKCSYNFSGFFFESAKRERDVCFYYINTTFLMAADLQFASCFDRMSSACRNSSRMNQEKQKLLSHFLKCFIACISQSHY